jgi:hypothetical protein
MRTLFLATAAFAALVIGAPVGAQAEYVHGWVNGQYFHGTINNGPSGFGAGFAQGWAAVQDAGGAGGGAGGAGLGSYLPGVITAQDGRQLSFEIQVSSHGGGVRASDPQKHEQFAGTYAASGGGFFTVPATVRLTGNRGTSISCHIDIRAGDVPTGNGSCTDQRRGGYTLQF